MTSVDPISLLARPVIEIRQRAKLFELRNQYELLDEAGDAIGSVEQVHQSGLAVLARIASDLDVMLPVDLEVSQGGQRVLLLRKPWFRMAVEVIDAGGQPLGSIRKRVRLGKAVFELRDAAGRPLGEVRAQSWRAKEFAVRDLSGGEVGRVTKRWSGIAREVLTDADRYVLRRPAGLADPLPALTLAVPFAIDLVMKQKDSA